MLRRRLKDVAFRLLLRARRTARAPRLRRGHRAGPPPRTVVIEVQSLDVGGLERFVLHLVRNLDRRRFRPVVACVERGGSIADRIAATGTPVHVVGPRREAFAAILEREQADLLNAHYSVFGAPIAAALGIPQVHVLQNSYLWLDDGGARRFAWAFADVDRFVAVSSTVRDYARRRFRIPPERLEVVPNCVDLAALPLADRPALRAAARAELGLAPEAPVFLHAGTYEPRKGHRALLEAFAPVAARFPAAALVCVGNAPEPRFLAECEARVKALGLEARVRLLGYRDDLHRLYAAADAFVLPSIVEGFSLATLEAAAFGLPLVLTDVGGARDLLGADPIGRLLPGYLPDLAAATPEELAHIERTPPAAVVDGLRGAMVELCERPEAWREAGARGAALVARDYRVEAVVRRYEDVFEAALR